MEDEAGVQTRQVEHKHLKGDLESPSPHKGDQRGLQAAFHTYVGLVVLAAGIGISYQSEEKYIDKLYYSMNIKFYMEI